MSTAVEALADVELQCTLTESFAGLNAHMVKVQAPKSGGVITVIVTATALWTFSQQGRTKGLKVTFEAVVPGRELYVLKPGAAIPSKVGAALLGPANQDSLLRALELNSVGWALESFMVGCREALQVAEDGTPHSVKLETRRQILSAHCDGWNASSMDVAAP